MAANTAAQKVRRLIMAGSLKNIRGMRWSEL
jgi:hypothetical protein